MWVEETSRELLQKHREELRGSVAHTPQNGSRKSTGDHQRCLALTNHEMILGHLTFSVFQAFLRRSSAHFHGSIWCWEEWGWDLLLKMHCHFLDTCIYIFVSFFWSRWINWLGLFAGPLTSSWWERVGSWLALWCWRHFHRFASTKTINLVDGACYCRRN